MFTYKDDACGRIETIIKPAPKQVPKKDELAKPAPKKVIKSFYRQTVFPAKRLESETEIDAYVESVRQRLKQLMQNCDGIELN